ncbi:glycosyltransferase [Oryzobacter telluris]|uniref:glycosyltransferase n=1 Tax=Oryzobacter telluris TaxID=3149179 RepID=UPI00370DB0FD
MIVVGCCVGPGGRYDRITGPSLASLVQPDDVVVLVEGASGICGAYNAVLRRAREVEGCQGVLLVHDDVELPGRDVRDALLAAATEPGVGLVGVAGGRGLAWGKWWSGRHLAGHRNDTRGTFDLGRVADDVDAVDGCLMFITPRAVHVDFDEVTFPAFHGYDVDFSLQVRSAGLRVVTRSIPYRHLDKGSAGDDATFVEAMRDLEAKWPGWIRPPSVPERMVSRMRHVARRGRTPGS